MLVERTDLRVAVREAVFEVSEAKRWLLGGYNHGHVANLPYPIAMEMALGFRFTAQRFYEVGFLNRIVDAADLMPTAMGMAEHLLTLPPASRVNTVHMMRHMRPSATAEHADAGRGAARPRRQGRPHGIARRLRREAQAQLQGLEGSRGPPPPADPRKAPGRNTADSAGSAALQCAALPAKRRSTATARCRRRCRRRCHSAGRRRQARPGCRRRPAGSGRSSPSRYCRHW